MKRLNAILALALAAIAASSCGLAAKYDGIQQFQDGIYFQAQDIAAEPPLSQEDFEQMAREEIRRESLATNDGTGNVYNFYYGYPYGYGYPYYYGYPHYYGYYRGGCLKSST